MQIYKKILTTAWSVTKKNPVLWLFGFFLLFWMGKGMEFESFFTSLDLYREKLSPLNPEFWEGSGWVNILQHSELTTATLILLLLVAGLLAVFVFGLITVSQIGLADAFGRFSSPRKRKKYTLSEAIKVSSKSFLPVAVINLVGKGASLALLALAALPLFVAGTHTGQLVYTLALYLLAAPVVVLISIWINYAVNDAVLNETQVDEAMNNGWLLLRHNFGISVELALLLFGIYFLVLIAGYLLGGLLLVPLVLGGGSVEWLIGADAAQQLFYLIFAVLASVIMVFAVVLFSTWSRGCWTLLYVELTKGKKRSKIHRLLTGDK